MVEGKVAHGALKGEVVQNSAAIAVGCRWKMLDGLHSSSCCRMGLQMSWSGGTGGSAQPREEKQIKQELLLCF